MGKISPVSAKYIIHASINISGVVDRPDVIGAIFGQTEGLLGAEMELRELQRSGRIGRIEVNVETSSGKTNGSIEIPSSLDKSETSIVGAALEVIDRIGPCEAKIRVHSIEDVRVSKREYVITRAKELLRELLDKSLPDSQEIADEVAQSVRVMELTNYGRERLPAGPNLDDCDEIIIVEGRADVINLLKHGIKNSIAMNGTNVPETIKELSKGKIVTAFVDGDRGGDLIIQELMEVAEIDYVSKAPDGKEVEEMAKKEIHKALRSRVTIDQYRLDKGLSKPALSSSPEESEKPKPKLVKAAPSVAVKEEKPIKREEEKDISVPVGETFFLSDVDRTRFKEMADQLIGSRGAFLLDEKLKVMGKVPLSELSASLKDLESKVFAIVMDGPIDKDSAMLARKANVKCVVGRELKADVGKSRVALYVADEL